MGQFNELKKRLLLLKKNTKIYLNKKNLYNNDLIKYYFFLSLLIIFSIFSSFQQAQYYYDGLHWGDRVANAKDLLNGRLPYKDFFINYFRFTVSNHLFNLP